MRFDRTLFAIVLPLSVHAAGCGEEVGPCDDIQEGEDTVLVGNTVQFGGQAIMNLACASCHSSQAKGAARQGAPAGLDFDLLPLDPEDPAISDGTIVNNAGQTLVKLKPSAVAGLRQRQRRVFEDRETIFQQVKDDMMPPPGGKFDAFRSLARIVGTANTAPCQADVGAFEPLSRKSSRDVLRKWLACRAPIVEINSSDKVKTKPESVDLLVGTSDAGVAADAGVTFAQAAGLAGYQYEVCEVDGGAEVTLERVYDQVFSLQCSGCHNPGGMQPDLSTVDSAYAALVEDSAVKCAGNGKPYVSKGDPAKSFLYELVSEEQPTCSMRMPTTGRMMQGEIKLIEDWIRGGALRDRDVAAGGATQSLPRGVVGIDAGVP